MNILVSPKPDVHVLQPFRLFPSVTNEPWFPGVIDYKVVLPIPFEIKKLSRKKFLGIITFVN